MSDHEAHRHKRALSYFQVRALLLAAGVAFLGVTAAVTYVRRVETVEVVAILLFMPIFVAFVMWDWIGGAVAAVGAIATYLAMRADAIHTVGFGQFSGVIFSRSLAFLAFGIVGGLANRYVRASLTKLDLYDQVDDVTGLYNARDFLTTTELEMSRATRYQSIFSVSVVEIPVTTFVGVSRRRRRRALRDIGAGMRASVRTVDRVAHGSDAEAHRFAVVLPETAEQGAQVFTERLAERLGTLLNIDTIRAYAVTYPGDNDALRRLRAEFADIDRAQHPEHPTAIGIVAA